MIWITSNLPCGPALLLQTCIFGGPNLYAKVEEGHHPRGTTLREAPVILGIILKIAGSSQRPRPQVAAAARFRGHNDHRTLRQRVDVSHPESDGKSVDVGGALNPYILNLDTSKCHFSAHGAV